MALVQKAFSEIITFSRSSNATRVGPTGLVEYAPHNLLTYSQALATWATKNGTFTNNSAAAPDGTVTATRCVATDADPFVYQSQTLVAQQYTLSVWIKGEGSAVGKSGTLRAGLNISSLQTITANWQRYSFTFTASATSQNVGFEFPESASVGDTVYFWGAQLSVGPLALDYTPTTTAAVYGPRFDFDGSGVTSVDPIARNLVLYSEQFDNAYWTKGASISVSANASTAPDGAITADSVTFTGTGAATQVYRTVTVTSGAAYTISLYIKYVSGANGDLLFSMGSDATRGARITVTSTSLVISEVGANVTSSGYQQIGNGWFRVYLTITSTSTSFEYNLYRPVAYGGAGANVFLLWGAQLEIGSTATGYMVSGATNGFRAVPVVTGSATPRGLLVEEQRVNVYTYSEQFDNAAWTKAGSSITANAGTAPDGTVTADKIVEDSGTTAHVAYQTPTVSAVAYTLSVFAKAAERTQLVLDFTGGSNNAIFNLSAGTVVSSTGSGLTAAIQDFGNGWYRCSITQTQSAGTIFPSIGPASGGNRIYTGNGSSGILIWGAQLEAGSFATSLIPTLASSVTRSADVASVNTLSPFYNAVEGTLFTEAANLNGQYPHLASFETDSSNAIWTYAQQGTYGNLDVLNGGATQASINTAPMSVVTVKVAGAYKANDFAVCLNGGTVVTDTSGTIPSVNKLQIGTRTATQHWANGHIRRIAYFPRRLQNAEIQALTA